MADTSVSASPDGIVTPQPAWRIVSADSQCSGPTKMAGRPLAIAPYSLPGTTIPVISGRIEIKWASARASDA